MVKNKILSKTIEEKKVFSRIFRVTRKVNNKESRRKEEMDFGRRQQHTLQTSVLSENDAKQDANENNTTLRN